MSKQAICRIQDMPGPLNIVGYRNGFFAEDEIATVIDTINAARPDILLIGLGLPQKEHFIHDHFGSMNVRFCISVGGAIDVWANDKKRAPNLIQMIGMEWLYRSFSNIQKSKELFAHGRVFASDFIANLTKSDF